MNLSNLNSKIALYLAANDEAQYPSSIIDELKSLGVFGLTIPRLYGGGEADLLTISETMFELSKEWLSVTALLGTHYRVVQYFINCSTQEQRGHYLPKLATGELIGAHAFHERGIKQPALFNTILSKRGNAYLLNGEKHWVTNAENANFILVIANNRSDGENDNRSVAIILDRKMDGVDVEPSMKRPGIKGISLNRVRFNNCVIDPIANIIGNINGDVDEFINSYRPGSSLSFASRCMGAAYTVYEDCKNFLQQEHPTTAGREVIKYKFGALSTKYYIAKSLLDYALVNINSHDVPIEFSHMVKVHCSTVLQEIVQGAIHLQGGYGYAGSSTSIERIFRDAQSLVLIDTPNDVLLYRIGDKLLNK